MRCALWIKDTEPVYFIYYVKYEYRTTRVLRSVESTLVFFSRSLVHPKRPFFLSATHLRTAQKQTLSVIATMQQRTNAESIRAESEKVRQANEERLREKRMVRVPLFDPHSHDSG
jgi:hypothetical protein